MFLCLARLISKDFFRPFTMTILEENVDSNPVMFTAWWARVARCHLVHADLSLDRINQDGIIEAPWKDQFISGKCSYHSLFAQQILCKPSFFLYSFTKISGTSYNIFLTDRNNLHCHFINSI